MTLEAIRKKREGLDKKRNALKEKMAKLQKEYDKLYIDCDHENTNRGTDLMGYPEGDCLDCGYCY